MFTGIIMALGEVQERGAHHLVIRAPQVAEELEPGGSVAVSGVCLTAASVDRAGGQFKVELSPETLRRTTLDTLKAGDRVNLELPLRPGDRLGGHLVLGHVDTIGEVLAVEPEGEFRLFRFRVDPRFDPLLVEKGSVAIDGISLTPFHVTKGRFEVAVVPKTWQSTTLKERRPGDRVNVEFDPLAKYVAKQLQAQVLKEVRG